MTRLQQQGTQQEVTKVNMEEEQEEGGDQDKDKDKEDKERVEKANSTKDRRPLSVKATTHPAKAVE